MLYAVDSFLNNAVDLYIQAVEYCRISTSQIPTNQAGIRQTSPDSGDTVPDFGQTGQSGRVPDPDPAWIWTERPGPRHLAGSGRSGGISGQSGQDPPRTAGSLPRRPVSGQLAEIRLFSVGFRQRSPESGKNGQIPATLLEFVSAKY